MPEETVNWKTVVNSKPILRWDALPSVPAGEVQRLSFFSPALGLRRFLGVYRTSGPPLPRVSPLLITLFRGHYSEWFDPQEDPSRGEHPGEQAQSFVELLQQAVDQGSLPPCLAVFPDFGGDDRDGLTLAINWKDPRRAEGLFVGGGMGAFETSFREEFLPQFEEALGVFNPRRVALGFSLGGLNALQLALRNPTLFEVAAAYDPSLPFDPVEDDDAILRHPLFDPIFGRPADRAHLKAHSPVWLARNLPKGQLRRMRFFLASGPESAEPGDSNYYRTKQLVEALAERGVTNQMEQVVEEGNHNWLTADRFALRVLHDSFGLTG